VNYIEELLRSQIVAAIGKIVSPVDFAKYMNYHNNRVFKEQYRPVPFCYAIRREQHTPEGNKSTFVYFIKQKKKIKKKN
jgi:hypothetical protein